MDKVRYLSSVSGGTWALSIYTLSQMWAWATSDNDSPLKKYLQEFINASKLNAKGIASVQAKI